ncbi:MAG: hypothetical protein LIO43_01260 [Clostridiales bacterium]|nr:hypothetical protein [Clostridiales bacterium]
MKILIFVLIAAAVLILLLFLVCAVVFNELVWHKTIPVPKFITGLIAGNDSSEKSFETDSKKGV